MPDYSPIREFHCAAKKCKAKTSNWFKEGWAVVGLNDYSRVGNRFDLPRQPFEETEFARRLLGKNGFIRQHDLAAALICPEHNGEISRQVDALRQAHLGEHVEPDVAACDLCRREMSYKVSADPA